jgi:hypothetical protein
VQTASSTPTTVRTRFENEMAGMGTAVFGVQLVTR